MKSQAAICGVLFLLMTTVGMAQETTGGLMGMVIDADGLPLPGVTVRASDQETGFERSVSTDSGGNYRLPALSPSRYELAASGESFRNYRAFVSVSVGQTVQHDIEMVVGTFTDVLEVDGETSSLNARSTVSGLTVNAGDWLAQTPIKREVTQIALLAPGSFGSPGFWEEPEVGWGLHTPGQTFASVAAASIGENAFVVNGLNVSNFRYGLGASFVPMVFVDQVQVKTGGYEAEYGRATGGVINMVTKRGSNIFRGGLSLYLEPDSLQSQEPDSAFIHNHREQREELEGNAWLGGPIIRDRLFFFAFLQYTDHSEVNNFALWWQEEKSERTTPYWGGKLDWLIGSSNRIEGTFFSDSVAVKEYLFDYDPWGGEIIGFRGTQTRNAGGNNFVLSYSGVLRSNLLLSAAVGRNEFDRSLRFSTAECPAVIDERPGRDFSPGCEVGWWHYPTDTDNRNAFRADLDWFLGGHSLRVGADYEHNESRAAQEFSGGVQYIYRMNGVEGEDSNTFWEPELPWDQDIAFVSHYTQGGLFDTYSNAFYAQDSWAVGSDVTLNLGLRWEGYENRNGLGETFIETNDQWAPRLGVIWDMRGDGKSKLYASAGVYHLPVYSKYNIHLASAVYDSEARYLFDGELQADGSPSTLGEEIYTLTRADGLTPDPREVLSENFDPMSQQEFSIGYERMVGENWTFGVRGVAKRFDQILEDYAINLGLYEHLGVECANPALTGTDAYCGHAMRLGNPGSDFRGWYDVDGDSELDHISIPAEALGIPPAELKGYAVGLTVSRRFSDRWMLNGSYTWSHTYGNYGGVVDSDLIINTPLETSSFFDSGTLMENSYGDLPQDRRHNLKAFGMYSFDFGLQVGASFFYHTGQPINSFGRHPWDPFAQSYYNPYVGVTSSFYTADEPQPRGCCGRTDDVWSFDLMLNYTFSGMGGEWFVRCDVFNVTNNSAPELVWDFAEFATGGAHPVYGETVNHQRPRSVRLGLGWSF